MSNPARYSSRPFPPYRYVPGRAPHPTRDPEGHSFNKHPAPLEKFDPDGWAGCADYLYGIDLFNHRYWWEAHEALEQCWVAAGRESETGLFLQGLIQIAVACLKQEQGFADVARRMAEEGMQKFPHGTDEFLGINFDTLRAGARAHVGSEGPPPVIKLIFPE